MSTVTKTTGLGQLFPSCDKLYAMRFESLKTHYDSRIGNIQRAATLADTFRKAYADETPRKLAASTKEGHQLEADKVEADYRKIRKCEQLSLELANAISKEYQYNLAQPIPTYEGNGSDLTERKREQVELQKFLTTLQAVNAQFAQRMPKFLYHANNYMHVLKTGAQLSTWQAGLVSTGDFYKLNEAKPSVAQVVAAAAQSDSPKTDRTPSPQTATGGASSSAAAAAAGPATV